MPHAATAVCWLSIAAIFRQPSILRNLICPLATRLKSRISAASSLGSEPCVFHCVLGKMKKRAANPAGVADVDSFAARG